MLAPLASHFEYNVIISQLSEILGIFHAERLVPCNEYEIEEQRKDLPTFHFALDVSKVLFWGLNVMALSLPRHLEWESVSDISENTGSGTLDVSRTKNEQCRVQNVARFQPRPFSPARQTRMFLTLLQ